VVPARHGNDLEARGDQLGYPERYLVGLRPRAAEETDAQRIGDQCGETLGQQDTSTVGEPVPDVQQHLRLLADHLGDRWVGMTGAHAELAGPASGG
jgi:hypothetical protein